MVEIVPPLRPLTSRDGVLSFIDDGLPLPPFPFLVGRRGFYGDSMGARGANDINIYDDAYWIVERSSMVAFNANCDPGRHRKGMANLEPGRWLYRPGIHKLSDPDESSRYEALVQAEKVVVRRDDTSSFKAGTTHPEYGECLGDGRWRGFFGINHHCGGFGVTSSLGCQTIPPAQWGSKHGPHKPGDFMHCIHAALTREGRNERGKDTLVYILTERYA